MLVLSIGSTITPRDLPDKVLGDVPKDKWQPLDVEEGNPSQMLQQSLRQSFHVGIPEEGINLKKMVEGFEKELLLEALEKTGWVKNKAANLLGLNRTTLVEKLKKMKITNSPGYAWQLNRSNPLLRYKYSQASRQNFLKKTNL